MSQNTDKRFEKMTLKILYSFDEKHLMTCLAWHENPVLVEIMSLDSIYKEKIGLVSLKTCVLTVIAKSPELVLQKGYDFTIYTLDPSEDKEVFSGQGMLSWILNVSLQTKDNCKNVSGRIIHTKKTGNKEKMILEIVMRLSRVLSTTQANLLNTMQDFRIFHNPSSPPVSGISELISSEVSEKNKNTFFDPPIYLYNPLLKSVNESQNNFQESQKNAFDVSQSSILLPFKNLTNSETYKPFSQISFLEQLSSPTSEPLSPRILSSSSSSPQYQLPPSSPPMFSCGNQLSYLTSESPLSFPDYFETSFTEMNTITTNTKKDLEERELSEKHKTFKSSKQDNLFTTQELKDNDISDDELPERKKLNEAVRAAQLALEGFSVIKLADKVKEGNKIATDSSAVSDENNNKGNKSRQSGKKISNALRVEMNLLKCIQEGKIPNYCNNCGTIKTVSWRRVKTAEDRPEETLCNPCGVWWSSHKSMRPSHLWREETITLNFHNMSDALYSKKTKRKVSYINKNENNLKLGTKKKYTGNKVALKKQDSTFTDKVSQSSPKFFPQEIITRDPFSELDNKDNWLYLPQKSTSTINDNEKVTLKSFDDKENKDPEKYSSLKKINDTSLNNSQDYIKTTPKKNKNVFPSPNSSKSMILNPQPSTEMDTFMETQKDYDSLNHYQTIDSEFLKNDLTNTGLLTSSTSLLNASDDKIRSKITYLKDSSEELHKTDISSDLFMSNEDTQDNTDDLWTESLSSPNSNSVDINDKTWFLKNMEDKTICFSDFFKEKSYDPITTILNTL